MCIDILSGFLANLFFAIFLIAVGWVIYYLTERRKLLKFFNIENTKRLIIYLSNLRINPGGAVGIDGKRRSYNGKAVVYDEQVVATKFRERFNYLIPSLSESPSFLRKIVFADINISIIPSPLQDSEIETNCSLLTFGSPGYNIVSTFIEKNPYSVVRFSNDNTGIQVQNLPNINIAYHGFIQRLVLKTSECERNLFYIAGLSTRGTVGAGYYLLKNWKNLRKKYKDDESFIIVIAFPTENLDTYSIVFEKKISK